MTSLQEQRELQKELSEWRKRLELFWRQKSCEIWLKEGDKNSKFFHALTVENQRRNFISAMKDDEGVWKVTRDEIGSLFTKEFTKLFKVEEIQRSEQLSDFIHCSVSSEENARLEAIPTVEEIWSAVKTMHPIKAPRPDGMPALFFQKYWHIVGNDMMNMVQNVFSSGYYLET